jgi:DNA-binding Lrp family transcriptional regulator
MERKLISELMKNSRRSDRELAKAIGTSQPTTTRLRTKLEKEGYIKEYTIIPRFSKLGYHILAITYLKLKREPTEKENAEAKRTFLDRLAKIPHGIAMFKPGMGGPFDTVAVSLHPDYASVDSFRNQMRNSILPNASDSVVFLVNLDEESQNLPLTFSLLANNLLELKEQE